MKYAALLIMVLSVAAFTALWLATRKDLWVSLILTAATIMNWLPTAAPELVPESARMPLTICALVLCLGTLTLMVVRLIRQRRMRLR